MYLRPAASVRGNGYICAYMLNILRWDGLCENVNGYYWYYRPVGVTASSVGAAPVIVMYDQCHVQMSEQCGI